MVKTQRHEEILRYLQKAQCANVEDICAAVYASPATVRRDLRSLEAERKVRLFHGGVTLPHNEQVDVPLSVRELQNQKIKRDIAYRAAQLIPAGASMLLDASSTCMYLAGCIDPANENTVFTNCLRTAAMLCERNIRSYCVGGAITRLSLATTGALAQDNLKRIQVDYLFFSSQGLSDAGLITDNSEGETILRREMLDHAKQRFFLCDSSKVGQKKIFSLCNVCELDGVISDADLSDMQGVNWIKA